MKSLNRTLSLVLVLAMCLGLMGVASAAAFTDKSSVQYGEAVDVMTGIGAINGYTDGSFKPAGTITREEAAKMITYAILGPTVASKLSVTATGFSDVAANRWSAPYIAYCVGKGIINGMGDGTFAPTANVTGYQIAKMMLCAAGYGKKSEFTGSGWELNVAVEANRSKVFSGSKASDYSKAATREEAALYVFNAQTKAATVSYSKLTEDYTTVANASAYEINEDNCYQIAESVYTTLTKETSYTDGRAGYYWKLGSDYISDFVGSDDVLASSTNGTTLANLTTATSASYIKYQADSSVSYYYNDYKFVVDADNTADVAYAAGTNVLVGSIAAGGTLYTVNAGGVALGGGIAAGSSSLGAVAFDGKSGVIVKFTDTDSNGKYNTVSFVSKTAVQLSSAPTATTVGTVTTVVIPGVTSGISSKLVSYPAGLVKGDTVLYYTSGDGTLYVEKANVVTGTLTAYTDSSKDSIVVDGKTYTLSDLAFNGSALNGAVAALSTAAAGKAGTTFFLDNGGNVVGYSVASATIAVDKVLFVRDSLATTSMSTTTVKAEAVFSDGTTSVITVKKVAAADAAPATATVANAAASALTTGVTGTVADNSYYTYTKNDDGSYNLTAVELYNAGRHVAVVDAAGSNNAAGTTFGTITGATANTDTYATIAKGQANFLSIYTTADNGANFTAAPAGFLATNATVFVVYNSANQTYKTYTGISNVPNITVCANTATVDVMMNAAGTYAALVVIGTSTSDNSSSSVDYAFVYSGATYHYDATNPYYSFKAIVNGVDGEIKASTSNFFTAGNTYRITAYSSGLASTKDTAAPVYSALTAQTKITVADGTMAVYNGASLTASYVLSSTVKAFVYNSTYGTITAVDASALPTTYTAGTYSVQSVATSTTNSAIAYVFVTVS